MSTTASAQPSLDLTKNGHSLRSKHVEGVLCYECADCNMQFLTLDAVDDRRPCPE